MTLQELADVIPTIDNRILSVKPLSEENMVVARVRLPEGVVVMTYYVNPEMLDEVENIALHLAEMLIVSANNFAIQQREQNDKAQT